MPTKVHLNMLDSAGTNFRMNIDVLGKAIVDYYHGKRDGVLHLHTSYGDTEDMPIEVFFRQIPDMTDLELMALENCHGSVLDVGAGAGSFTIALQKMQHTVHAVEVSKGCVDVLLAKGVDSVFFDDVKEYRHPKVDTVLLMMNGLGLAGRLSNLVNFMKHLKSLLNPGGFILADSSDISYLYKRLPKPTDHYYGEVKFQFEYQGVRGQWFDWVYIDVETLKSTLEPQGWTVELLYQNKLGEYLVKLIPN